MRVVVCAGVKSEQNLRKTCSEVCSDLHAHSANFKRLRVFHADFRTHVYCNVVKVAIQRNVLRCAASSVRLRLSRESFAGLHVLPSPASRPCCLCPAIVLVPLDQCVPPFTQRIGLFYAAVVERGVRHEFFFFSLTV